MNRRLPFILFGLWSVFFSAVLLPAQQVGFILPSVNNAVHNQVINLPVRVTNFDSILSFQFVIQWDTAVLKYLTYNGYSVLPNADGDNFGASETSKGILRFAWPVHTVPDSVANGLHYPDSTAIFKIRFTVIGENGDYSPLTITQLPPITFFEVVRYPNHAYSIDSTDHIKISNGYVAVGFTPTATEEPGVAGLELPVRVFPNPFSDKTQVEFELPVAERFRASLSDAAGRLLFEQDADGVQGLNALELSGSKFPAPGAYFLMLRSAHFSRSCSVYIH